MTSIDREPLPHGKYEGRTPEQVADQDPGYIIWLYENVLPKRCTKALMLACLDAVGDPDIEVFE